MSSVGGPSEGPAEPDEPHSLFSTRTLLIVLVASAIAFLMGIGAGLTAWNAMIVTGGNSIALIAAFLAGGATWCWVFISIAAVLHRLVA